MGDSPLVSAIIPTHNRADLVSRAIDSVLSQKEAAVEVIVVDDGSTDNTSEVLARYGGAIRLVSVKESVERGAARNLGATAARGDILAFLDSDDTWEPNKLALQLPALASAAAVVTGSRFVDPQGRTLRIYNPPAHAPSRLLLKNEILAGPSSVLVRANAFAAIGGFPEEREVQGTEDWLFFIKLWRAGHRLVVVPDALVRYLVHDANSTRDPDSVARAMWAATRWIEQHGFSEGRELRRLKARTAGVIGRHFTARLRWREALVWARRLVEQHSWTETVAGLTIMCLSILKAAGRRLLGPTRRSG